jgi:ankyrin repeat protein
MGEEDIVRFIKKNDVESVKKYIKAGFDLDAPCADSENVFCYVSEYSSNIEIAKIIEAENPRTRGYNIKDEVLISAVLFNNLKLAKKIIEDGANPNAYNMPHGSTNIWNATMNDNEDMVKLLLEFNPDIDAEADDTTPLLNSINNDNYKIQNSIN